MLKLQNVRTGTRVAVGFGLILFALVALTIVGITRVNKINASLTTINDINSVKETYAIAFRGSVILQSVRQVNEIMAEIAAASEEQSIGIEQVGQAIVQMDEATQQNAALVEQASAATRSLEEQAFALRSAVGAFRIRGSLPTERD
ncbi:methyl-accepting chemotaxis protein [Paraburkholderia sp. GAS334]